MTHESTIVISEYFSYRGSLKVNEQLTGLTVSHTMSFAFQAPGEGKILQKNIVLRCGESYNYYEFSCDAANACEAKIVQS